MKFYKKVCFAVLGLLCISGISLAVLDPTSLKEDAVSAEGLERRPVFATPLQLAQGTYRNFNDETLNADEEDPGELQREFRFLNVVPRIVPQHRDQLDRRPAGRAAIATSAPPVVTKSFPGISNTGTNQPDSIVAVGPAHVLVAVNTVLGLYTRAGQRRFQIAFEDWFSPLAGTWGGATLFDPRVLYDQYSGHYIFLCTARRSDHRSWYLLSVSKTSNPQGPWGFWVFDMQLNGTARVDLWADFPRLGVDANALYLTANMYTFGTYIFRYSKIRVLRKSDVYAFGELPFTEFRQMVDAAGAYAHSIEPAHSYGPAPSEFLVNTRMDAADKITVWKITATPGTKPTLVKIPVAVSSFQAPAPAQQKGGGALINAAAEGTGVLSAVYRKGFLYTVFPIAKNWGSGQVSALRYYQIASNGALVEEVTYGSDGVSYYMPAVAVDSKGNVILAFTRSSASEFAGFFVAGKKATKPPAEFSSSIPLQKGLANYKIVFRGSNIARWGDYNGITAGGDDTFWAYGQYAASATEWQTVVAQLAY